jgi:hypothetical protein
MNKLIISVSLTTLAALGTASQASASSTPAGFDSCVTAFVNSLPEKLGSSPRLKAAHYVDSLGGSYAPSELIMTARNSKTNKTVWKSSCVVNSSGEVTGMRDINPVTGM